MHLGLTWFNSISDKLTYLMGTGNHPIFSALNFDPPNLDSNVIPNNLHCNQTRGKNPKGI